MRTDHVFVRLDDFDFEEFLQHALPALEQLDPSRLLELLTNKLARAVKLAVADDDDSYPGSSTRWVRDLDQPDPADGALAQLARAVARIAINTATTERSAEVVMENLERHDHEIFRRIRLRVLAAAGQFVPERVNAFLTDRTSLEREFRGREVAAVVREQFSNPSPDAQRALVQALEAGPTRYAADLSDTADPSTRADELAAWQRRRLMWFRGRIPEALQDLARRLGVDAQRHSPEQEGLAEDGFYIAGGFVGERSPVSLDEIRQLDVDAFVEYVVTWQPDPTAWTPPTREGLDGVLAEYAAQDPAGALERALRLTSRLKGAHARAAGHLQGLLDGLKATIDAGTPIDWSAALRFLEELWPELEDGLDREEKKPGWQPWRWLATALVDFLIAACRKNALPPDAMEQAWGVITRVIESPHVWDSAATDPLKSFGDVLSAALNNSGGRAIEAALELACAEFRVNLGKPERDASAEEITAAAASVPNRLRPLLEHALRQVGRSSIAARATIGTYVPAIHLLDREWLLGAAPRIFDRGTVAPLESPAWGAYLTRAALYNDVFRDLRDWYVRAANDMPVLVRDSDASERDQWSIPQHLAEHVFGAYMRGLIDVTDENRLLDIVFQHLSPKKLRSHYRHVVRISPVSRLTRSKPRVATRRRIWRRARVRCWASYPSAPRS